MIARGCVARCKIARPTPEDAMPDITQLRLASTDAAILRQLARASKKTPSQYLSKLIRDAYGASLRNIKMNKGFALPAVVTMPAASSPPRKKKKASKKKKAVAAKASEKRPKRSTKAKAKSAKKTRRKPPPLPSRARKRAS